MKCLLLASLVLPCVVAADNPVIINTQKQLEYYEIDAHLELHELQGCIEYSVTLPAKFTTGEDETRTTLPFAGSMFLKTIEKPDYWSLAKAPLKIPIRYGRSGSRVNVGIDCLPKDEIRYSYFEFSYSKGQCPTNIFVPAELLLNISKDDAPP